MNISITRSILSLILCFMSLSVVAQQTYSGRRPQQPAAQNEYAMSHVEVEAGGLTGLALPQWLAMMPKKSYRWVPVESGKISVVDHSETSATVRALRSGSTVVNFVYKYLVEGEAKPVMKDGHQVVVNGVPQVKVEMIEREGTYPFTIKVFRVEAETMSVPSVIRIGWDEEVNIDNLVSYYPKYAETELGFTIEDVNVAEIVGEHRVRGMQLGTTPIRLETSNGLTSTARIEVIVPELRRISIDKQDRKVSIGEEFQLTYSYSPYRAEPTFTWRSSNPEIMEVTPDGRVKALSPGKVTIILTSDNGVKDDIDFKVLKK